MKSAVYVELDIPYCSLIYGESPCTAAQGVTGDIKCFNTLATCQDVANFTRDNRVTLRFRMDTLDGDGPDALPCLIDYSLNPGKISLGENLGTRTSVIARFRDMKHSDAGEGFDKYWRERGINPYELGTLWGKFRARHPYIRWSPMRLIQGFVGQPIEEMETRHFIVDEFNGPNRDGEYTLVGRDLLKMLDADRAQAPRVSPGYLVNDYGTGVTSVAMAPAGIGDEFYPTSGLMAIGGKEIVSFTRSGNNLTIVRAQEGTEASELKAQDRCQIVLKYTAQDAAFIQRDLMVNYAFVPEDVIPYADWLTETAKLQTAYTRTIPEPTSVRKLLIELVQSAALKTWWDELDRQQKLRVIAPIVNAPMLDQRAQLQGSLNYHDQPNSNYTEMWTYFGIRNPLRPTTDPDNYLSVERRFNSEAASNYGEDLILKRFAPWIPQLARQTADRLNILTLSRFQTPPRLISGAVFRKGLTNPLRLGDGVTITDRFIQKPTGEPDTLPAEVVRINPRRDRLEFEAEEARWTFLEEIDLTDRIVPIDVNMNNINLRTLHDNMFPPLREGDTVSFVIGEGVTVGSTSTDLRACTLGSWPGWIELTMLLNGRIQGRGGRGGHGRTGPGNAGLPGGPALYLRRPLRMIYGSSAQIWGGAGGGGSNATVIFAPPSGGGGGGAGTLGGNGGDGMGTSQPGNPGTPTAGGLGGLSGSGNGRSGRGGHPGQNGVAGSNAGSNSGGAGGQAGRSVDGFSHLITVSGTVDRRGPTAN